MKFRLASQSLKIVLLSTLCLTGCGRLGYDSFGRDAGAAIDMRVTDLGFDGGAPDMFDLGNVGDGAPADLGLDAGLAQTPGIVVMPTEGLVTTEMGGADTFTIVLSSRPSFDVQVMLSSSDPGEGTVSPSSVTFSSINWNAPQLVTITGQDDALTDGDVDYSIVTSDAMSVDPDYSGRDTADVSVTNRDDDTPGVLLSVTSGLRTSEAGGMDTFTLRLLAPPTADVTITLASDTLAEATVSPASLTFTPTNWAALQTATVVGVDDATADGDQPFAVLTGPATSVDTRYSGFDADDVTGSNRDDETARILIEPLAGLSTTEGGGTAMFSVVLQSPPEADVMVSIASSDLSEGTVSDASVVFTAGDWNVARAIVATGVDDSVSDGDQTYSVVVGAATSADPFYSGRAGGSVVVTNVDDDAPGITIVRPAVQTTTELGGTHTFTVVLDSQPSASVILAVTSTDTSEGTVSVASRIFSTSNWNIPQTITVTGADDFLADGDQLYDVLLHVSLSADGDYATLADLRVSMTNIDDETAGIVVSPTTGLTTTESLGSTTFTIVLRSMPTAPVSIGLSSDMTSEGTVAPASITFTTGNWSVAQTVTVTGVNDLVVDGSRIYHIVTAAASSADATYNGIDPSDVTVANLDNDSVAITVSPLSISAPEGGVSGTFAIVLGSMPTASVTVPLHMLSTAQGVISPASVTFTTANWSTPQIAMVSAVNDGIVDGQFTNTAITDPAVSTDMSYGGLNGADVTVIHDDIPAIIVAPTSGLTTAEDGATAMFTVSLTAAPTANVVVPVSSSDATEGALVGGVSNVVFTAADWTPRTVTVAGVNDTLDDSDQPYSVVLGAATSSDARYNGLNPADVSLTNFDDDTAGAVLTAVGGFTTSENLSKVQFLVALNTTASAQVNFNFSVSDATEARVSPHGVGMAGVAPYPFTVTGVDDYIVDGDIPYNVVVTTTSADPAYNGLTLTSLSMTNLDNEVGDVTVSPIAGLVVAEPMGTTLVRLRLARAPSSNVTIGLSSSDLTEGTVSPASVTFTTSNWATVQNVTVTGVPDGVEDGDQTFTIVTSPATSTDGSYSGADGPDVSVTSIDSETGRCVSVDASNLPSTGYALSFGGNVASTDGRYVVFDSHAATLVAGDTNGDSDVFVRDRILGTTIRASVTNTGLQASGSIGKISANGRFVLFTSSSSDVVVGDVNAFDDLFVRDTLMNTTTLVSVASTGAQITNHTRYGSISADGRYVAFYTLANDVVPGDTNGAQDVFVRDLMLATTTRVSLLEGAATGPSGGLGTYISPDGRYVAFSSNSQLTVGDTNSVYDAFVRDRMTNTTTIASLGNGGVFGNQASNLLAISADARYVAFTSSATNLVAGDTNGLQDVFVRDTLVGITTRVSVSSEGVQANGLSQSASISDDGSRLIFASYASNLVPGDNNGVPDAFAYDMTTGTTTMVSRSPVGAIENAAVLMGNPFAAIIPDGTRAVITTSANNIMYDTYDTDYLPTVYLVPVP